MNKKFRIGCLAVILYCLGCCLYVGISGKGFFWVFGMFGTIRGGHRISDREEFFLRGIDVITAPVQVPIWGLLYIKHVTGESGRIEREIKRQEAAYERYMKLLDENPDRIYVEPEFLNSTNMPAIKAVDCWTRYWHNRECGKLNDERLRRFAEYQLGHKELMLMFKDFWRRADLPEDLQRRALAVALKMAEENPSEDVRWLLLGIMGIGDGDKEQWTIPDDALHGYSTNQSEIIRWSAQQALRIATPTAITCGGTRSTHARCGKNENAKYPIATMTRICDNTFDVDRKVGIVVTRGMSFAISDEKQFPSLLFCQR